MSDKSLRDKINLLEKQVKCLICENSTITETDPIFTASPASQITQDGVSFTNSKDYNLLNNKPDLSLKADLVNGIVPANQLPSYVDDVIEVAAFANLPTIGEQGKIYISLDDGEIYRWSGSIYVNISKTVISTGTTDNPLANNRLQVITPNVKNIVVYDQQLEFVNSVVEPNTSTLKLKDAFVNSFLTEETDPIFTASPAKNITNQDITNWNNKLDKEEDTLQSVTSRGKFTTNEIHVGTNTNGVQLRTFGNSGAAIDLVRNGLFRISNDIYSNGIYSYNGPLKLFNQLGVPNLTSDMNGIGIKVALPSATLHTNGSIKHENITNAQGDDTFTKQVVAKADGTLGVKNIQSASSGVYTPTITNVTQDVVVRITNGSYQKIGDIVTATISINLNTLVTFYSGRASFVVSLPFPKISATNTGNYGASGLLVTNTGTNYPIIGQFVTSSTMRCYVTPNQAQLYLYGVLQFQYNINE